MLAKKTLEINPHHSVSKEMLRLIEDADGEALTEAHQEYARLLYSTALISSGFDVGSSPDDFTSPL
jgi:HSP90 family molecular chaperone